MSEGRYPGINFIEKKLKQVGGVLGKIKFEPGPTHFIGNFCPKEHITPEIESILEKGILDKSKLFGKRQGKKYIPGAISYKAKFLIEPPEKLPMPINNEIELIMGDKESYGKELFKGSDVTESIEKNRREIENILKNFESDRFKKDFDEKSKSIKEKVDNFINKTKTMSEQKLKEPLCFTLEEELGKGSYSFITKLIPISLLQYAPNEDTQLKINKKLIDYIQNLSDNILIKTSDEAEELFKEEIASIDKYFNILNKEVQEKFGEYLKWRLGLELFYSLAERTSDPARPHKPKVYLWHTTNLKEDIEEILEKIEGKDKGFGTVVIPYILDKDTLQIVENWLSKKSHSYIVLLDLINIPPALYKKPKSFIDNIKLQEITYKGTERHHARMATFFPPIKMKIEGRNSIIETYISPTFAAAAILSRTDIGYNLANRQYPDNIGVLEDLEEIFAEDYLNKEVVEKLWSMGVNTITKDNSWANIRERYIIEPMITLSSLRDRELLYYERIRANLEYLVSFYLRQEWQGKATSNSEAEIKKALEEDIFKPLLDRNLMKDFRVEIKVTDENILNCEINYQLLQVFREFNISLNHYVDGLGEGEK